MQRIRANFRGGQLDTTLAPTDGILSGTGVSNLPVITDGVNYIPISINPDGEHDTDPEIVYVTEHAEDATTATIARGQENTTAQTHIASTYWQHAPTAFDFDVIQTEVHNTDNGTTVHRLFVGETDPTVAGYTVEDGDVWIRVE